jgi:hypothetical protein
MIINYKNTSRVQSFSNKKTNELVIKGNKIFSRGFISHYQIDRDKSIS